MQADYMQMKYELNSPGKPPGLVRKLAALIMGAALISLVLMFSAVMFAILLVAGTIAWAYFWWRTRELRKMMRNFPPHEMQGDAQMSEGNVFEGEVIRVVDPQHRP